MHRSIAIMAIGLWGAFAGGWAQAQSLAIAPTTVEIDPARRNAVIRVENADDRPIDLQFRAYDWSQADGREQLSPTDAIVVSPAIVTVPAKGKQVFRVLLTDTPGTRERSFRLKLNQIPHPVPGEIGINVEFSLPVFVGPAGRAPALSAETGARSVTLRNTGNRRARITTLAVRNADGSTVPLTAAENAYLLAGTARGFALPGGAAAAPGARLVGTSDTGPIDVPLPALVAQR